MQNVLVSVKSIFTWEFRFLKTDNIDKIKQFLIIKQCSHSLYVEHSMGFWYLKNKNFDSNSERYQNDNTKKWHVSHNLPQFTQISKYHLYSVSKESGLH